MTINFRFFKTVLNEWIKLTTTKVAWDLPVKNTRTIYLIGKVSETIYHNKIFGIKYLG